MNVPQTQNAGSGYRAQVPGDGGIFTATVPSEWYDVGGVVGSVGRHTFAFFHGEQQFHPSRRGLNQFVADAGALTTAEFGPRHCPLSDNTEVDSQGTDCVCRAGYSWSEWSASSAWSTPTDRRPCVAPFAHRAPGPRWIGMAPVINVTLCYQTAALAAEWTARSHSPGKPSQPVPTLTQFPCTGWCTNSLRAWASMSSLAPGCGNTCPGVAIGPACRKTCPPGKLEKRGECSCTDGSYDTTAVRQLRCHGTVDVTHVQQAEVPGTHCKACPVACAVCANGTVRSLKAGWRPIGVDPATVARQLNPAGDEPVLVLRCHEESDCPPLPLPQHNATTNETQQIPAEWYACGPQRVGQLCSYCAAGYDWGDRLLGTSGSAGYKRECVRCSISAVGGAPSAPHPACTAACTSY
jgi:hypothetical protein